MSARCTSEPISWLRLERYQLGLADAAERARITEHVAACPACSGCLRSLEADDARPLLALPAPTAKVLPFPRRAATVFGTLAAAAAMLVVVRAVLPLELHGERVKGAEVAFSLVRGDGERIDGTGGVFREGDAFEALVTCAPPSSARFDLVVWDSKGASFPLEAPGDFACGNSRRLPGAFRLTGAEPQTVCLVWSPDGPVDRGVLSAGVPSGERCRCKRLQPAPR